MTARGAPPDLGIPDQLIEETLAPFVVERFEPGDARWDAQVHAAAARQMRRLSKRLARGETRGQAAVAEAYGRRWERTLDELLAPKPTLYEWRGRGFVVHSVARRKLSQLLIRRALEVVQPRTLLEVGAGTGFNLFLVAAQQPELRCTGLELTASGLQTAQAVQLAPELPAIMAPFAAGALRDRQAHRHVRFVRGSAAGLPFRDGSFDVVLTVLALEQMEAIRGTALAELRRVSARHVIMLEPFADWNAEGVRHDYVRTHDYFAETVEGLRRHGLRPVRVHADVPNKVTLHFGLVLAEIM